MKVIWPQSKGITRVENCKKKYFELFIVLILVYGLPTIVHPQNFWFEFQSEHAYRKNDFYINNLEDYYLSIVELRTGLHFSLKNSDFSFQPYVMISSIRDIGDNNWNEVDWHNNTVYGFGTRLRFNPGNVLFIHPREFNIDLFSEKLWVDYFSSDLFFIGHRPTNDFKAGLSYWLALGQVDNQSSFPVYFWLDNSGSFFYAKSSFFIRSQSNYYLVNSDVRMGPGIKIPRLVQTELYFTYRLTYDLGRNAWNRLDWHNRFQYGVGGRFKYTRFSKPVPSKVNIVIIPYIEYLMIKYPGKVQYIPSYRPKSDFHVGIALWVSFDNTKN